jgi:hypothetical protein
MRSRNALDNLPTDKQLALKGQRICRWTYYEQAAIRLYPSKEHEHALAVCFVRGWYTSGRSRVSRRPLSHVSTRIVYNSLYLKLSGKVQVTERRRFNAYQGSLLGGVHNRSYIASLFGCSSTIAGPNLKARPTTWCKTARSARGLAGLIKIYGWNLYVLRRGARLQSRRQSYPAENIRVPRLARNDAVQTCQPSKTSFFE